MSTSKRSLTCIPMNTNPDSAENADTAAVSSPEPIAAKTEETEVAATASAAPVADPLPAPPEGAPAPAETAAPA